MIEYDRKYWRYLSLKKRNTKKIVKWCIIGILLTFLTLFVVLCVFLYFMFFGGPAKVSKNIDHYESIFTEERIETGYIVFPEHIPSGTLQTEFYHSYQDTLFDPTVETYLQCTYDAKTYDAEIDRLENTSKTYGNRKCILLKDEKNRFQYPVYIAIDNAAHGYEYALLTGENQITYIYTCYKQNDNIHFNKDYLPSDYGTEEGRSFGSGYSIYYSSITSDAITTDYTRDAAPEVTDGHMQLIDDNAFVVHTRLDSLGKEIITQCRYIVDTPNSDKNTEIIHDDINGYEYKEMNLNKDRTEITITYIKNNQEMTQKYELR